MEIVFRDVAKMFIEHDKKDKLRQKDKGSFGLQIRADSVEKCLQPVTVISTGTKQALAREREN